MAIVLGPLTMVGLALLALPYVQIIHGSTNLPKSSSPLSDNTEFTNTINEYIIYNQSSFYTGPSNVSRQQPIGTSSANQKPRLQYSKLISIEYSPSLKDLTEPPFVGASSEQVFDTYEDESLIPAPTIPSRPLLVSPLQTPPYQLIKPSISEFVPIVDKSANKSVTPPPVLSSRSSGNASTTLSLPDQIRSPPTVHSLNTEIETYVRMDSSPSTMVANESSLISRFRDYSTSKLWPNDVNRQLSKPAYSQQELDRELENIKTYLMNNHKSTLDNYIKKQLMAQQQKTAAAIAVGKLSLRQAGASSASNSAAATAPIPMQYLPAMAASQPVETKLPRPSGRFFSRFTLRSRPVSSFLSNVFNFNSNKNPPQYAPPLLSHSEAHAGMRAVNRFPFGHLLNGETGAPWTLKDSMEDAEQNPYGLELPVLASPTRTMRLHDGISNLIDRPRLHNYMHGYPVVFDTPYVDPNQFLKEYEHPAPNHHHHHRHNHHKHHHHDHDHHHGHHSQYSDSPSSSEDEPMGPTYSGDDMLNSDFPPLRSSGSEQFQISQRPMKSYAMQNLYNNTNQDMIDNLFFPQKHYNNLKQNKNSQMNQVSNIVGNSLINDYVENGINGNGINSPTYLGPKGRPRKPVSMFENSFDKDYFDDSDDLDMSAEDPFGNNNNDKKRTIKKILKNKKYYYGSDNSNPSKSAWMRISSGSESGNMRDNGSPSSFDDVNSQISRSGNHSEVNPTESNEYKNLPVFRLDSLFASPKPPVTESMPNSPSWSGQQQQQQQQIPGGTNPNAFRIVENHNVFNEEVSDQNQPDKQSNWNSFEDEAQDKSTLYGQRLKQPANGRGASSFQGYRQQSPDETVLALSYGHNEPYFPTQMHQANRPNWPPMNMSNSFMQPGQVDYFH